jgi:hypothetical protein
MNGGNGHIRSYSDGIRPMVHVGGLDAANPSYIDESLSLLYSYGD